MTITTKDFKKALDLAISRRAPSGLSREEIRFFCLGVISEDDFTRGIPRFAPFDSHGSMMTQMCLTEEGRQKIDAAKEELGDWPDPPEMERG